MGDHMRLHQNESWSRLVVLLLVFAGSQASGDPPVDCPNAGLVLDETKISESAGGFFGELRDRDWFGCGLAAIGDLDGDGVSDIAVGAEGDDDGGIDTGAIWVLFMEPDGSVRKEQKVSMSSGEFPGELADGSRFGRGVAGIGDLDGDGTPDLAVGAYFDLAQGTAAGSIWVLFMRADGFVREGQRIARMEGGFDGQVRDATFFGYSVCDLGDLDGDGNTDIAVGAPFDDDGGYQRGAVWILLLNENGTVRSHQKISSTSGGFTGGLDDSDVFGASVAAIGDLDKDGVPDMVVGAPEDDDGGTGRGAVWILFLNADGTVKDEQKVSATAGGFGGALDNHDQFGWSVGGAGDLDGDGVTEIVVGADHDDDGGTGRGACWLLFMRTDGSVKGQRKISGAEGGFGGRLDDLDRFGASVAACGDLDADGRVEFAVGASADDDGNVDAGAVWMLSLHACEFIPCLADIDCNGLLDSNDFFGFLGLFVLRDPQADLTGDGQHDASDFFAFLDLFAAGCP